MGVLVGVGGGTVVLRTHRVKGRPSNDERRQAERASLRLHAFRGMRAGASGHRAPASSVNMERDLRR
jgi:hypothetical protein